MRQLPPEIYEKKRIQCYEEDTDDIQVYHTTTLKFPLSRRRRRFEIEKNLPFTHYGIGPDDRQKKVQGSWTI